MVKNKTSLNLISESRIGSRTANAGFFILMLITMVLLLPSISHADGLFDFQMKLAKKGNAEAEFKVGEMYETGFGVKEDMVEARNWITKAADQGHETAKFKLLYWDIEKNGVNDGNKAGLDSLKAKAKEGNPQAQYYIGKMLSRGIGVKKDTNKAINWLNKAALVGVLEAEREIVVVREQQQKDVIAKQRADEKRRAEQKARQERERQVRLEEQKKLQAQKQAEAKARQQEIAKKNAEADKARAKSSQAAAEKAEKEKLLAQRQAEERQREAQKKALIKKREAEEAKRKTEFESDPCSGKSARFLSTCK